MQITLEGKTKEQVAIERLQQYEPPEGYYLAFSGGKDSMCIYHLAVAAGVKFDAHYSVTGIDPPELVTFIKKNYKDVKFEMPEMSMWRFIEKKGLPTRVNRWCCQELKERGGEGRTCVMGIRAEESLRRKNTWRIFQTRRSHSKKSVEKLVLCPILDWTLLDVWDYIDSHALPYCSLYDNAFDQLGCVGCPLSSNQLREFTMYPKIRDAWYRATVRYFESNASVKAKRFQSAEHLWVWWLSGKSMDNFLGENQGTFSLTGEGK